jgi:hypothetical protein
LGGTQIGDQVDNQAPADLVLVGSGTTDKEANLLGPPQAVYRNREALLVPKGNPANIKALKDIANPGVKLAIGTPASAVGKLASQVVQNAAADYGFDFVQKVRANIALQADKGSDIVAAITSGKANVAIGKPSGGMSMYIASIPPLRQYSSCQKPPPLVSLPNVAHHAACCFATVKSFKLAKSFQYCRNAT